MQLVEHAKQGRFPRPRLLQPLVPPALEAVCLKAMSLNTKVRYQSATEVREETQRWLSDEPVSAWREPFIVRARRWIRRHQTAVVSTSAVVIMAVLSLSVLSVVVTGKNRDLKTANDAERLAREAAESNERRAINGETLARQNERRAIDGETLARKNEQRAIDGEQKAEAAKLVAEQNEHLAVQRAEEARRSLYFSSIALADAMRRRNQSRQAEETLDRCPPDLRNWEWHYLRRQCDHSIRTMDQQAAVSSVAVSQDGSLIASAAGGVYIGVSRDPGCVHIWDAVTGQRVRTINVTTGAVSSVAFHPNGNTIVTACTKGIVAVWKISDGKLVREIGRHTGIAYSAVFDSKGEHVLSGGADGIAKLWNSESGLIHEFANNSAVRDVALSHSGLMAATASAKSYRLWDIRSGKMKRELPTIDGRGNWTYHAFPTVCFMERDGVAPTLLTPQENATHDVGYWYTENSFALPWRGHTESVLDVASHLIHKRVASGSWDLTVRIWSPRGLPERTLQGHDDAVQSVAWTPNGEQVVSGSRDGTIKVWNALVDPEAMQMSRKSVEGLTLSPDGKWIGGNFTDSIAVWSLETGSEVLKIPKKDRFTVDKPLSPTCQVHVLPGRNGVVVLDKQNVHLLSLETGETLHTWEVFKRDPGNATEWQSALSSDGQQLAIFSKWEGITVWSVSRLTTGPTKRIQVVGLPEMIRFDVGDESRLIAVAGGVGILRADIHSGEITRQAIDGLGTSIASAALSSDGRLLAITPSSRNKNGSQSAATEIDLFDVSKGQFLRTLKGHQYLVKSLDFLPDGSRLISGSWDRTIKIWDVATGSEALTLTDMTEAATQLAVSPDGSQIVSSADSLRVWNGTRIEVNVPVLRPPTEKPESRKTPNVSIKKVETQQPSGTSLEKLMTFFKPPEMAGKPAPDFTLSLLNGEKFRLADRKGQVVILVFWTTWCAPCLDALTTVDRVIRELDSKEIQLVAVNVMEDEGKITSLLEKKSLSLTVVLDSDRAVSQLYHANGLPQTVIIDSGGNVHSNFSGVPPEEKFRAAITEASGGKSK